MPTANLASGFNRLIAYGKESTYGTKPARNSGTLLRRTAVDIQPTKDAITSNEIRSDYQRVEFRHGIRRVSGNINTELGIGTNADFLESLVRRDFSSNSSITLAAGVTTLTFNAAGTLTRSAGDFIADGWRVGDVFRCTGSSFTGGTAHYLTKNFRITGLTATVITSPDIDTTTAALSSNATVTVAGGTTFTPLTGHTTDSYTIEVYERGLDKSIAYIGTRMGSCSIDISPTAMATASYGVIGKNFEVIEESGGSSTDVPYYTSPAAAPTGTLVAGPNGVLRLGGSNLAIVTQATINIDNNLSADPVIGANTVPDVFYQGQTVNGQFTLFVQNMSMLKDFDAESELSFQILMEEPVVGAAAPGFVSLFLPRLKISGFNIPDNQGAIIQTVQFEALKPRVAASGNRDTQIVIQDSSQ